MGKRKIRNFLINKALQFRLTLKIVVPAFLLSLLSGALVFLSVWPLVTDVVSTGTISFLQSLTVIGLLLASVGMICLLGAWGIVVTHRIAGPVYRIEQALKQILRGEDINPIRLRNGDEFQDLVELLNQVIAHYQHGNSQEEDPRHG